MNLNKYLFNKPKSSWETVWTILYKRYKQLTFNITTTIIDHKCIWFLVFCSRLSLHIMFNSWLLLLLWLDEFRLKGKSIENSMCIPNWTEWINKNKHNHYMHIIKMKSNINYAWHSMYITYENRTITP